MKRFRRPKLEIPIRRMVTDAIPEQGVRERRSEATEDQLAFGRYRKWVVRGAVVCVFLIGLVAAMVGERGLWDLMRSRAEKKALRAEVVEVEQRIQALEARIELLRTDPQAYERLAREELGYVQPGETVYLFPRTVNSPLNVSEQDASSKSFDFSPGSKQDR